MGHPRAWVRCPSCAEGRVRGLNSNVIYPGQRPGWVLRFLPPEVEKAWTEAGPAHSAGVYMAAK
jgi:hypothetical protein